MTVDFGRDASLDITHLNVNVTMQREPEAGEECSYETIPSQNVPSKVSDGQVVPTPHISLIHSTPYSYMCEEQTFIVNPVDGYFDASLEYKWTFNSTDTLPTGFTLSEDKTEATFAPGSAIDPGLLTITVEAVSVINKKGTAEAYVDFVDGTNVITVSADQISPLIIKGDNVYEITGRAVGYDNCGRNVRNIGYGWSFVSSTDGSTPDYNSNGKNLALNAEEFVVGNEYEFKLRAWMTDKNNSESEMNFKVIKESLPIVAIIDYGGGEVDLPDVKSLDAGFSYDPDDKNASLDYSWTCE
jgi:hypothetical protein